MGEHPETHRWNIEETDFGFRVCRGEHDKCNECEWEYFYEAEEQAAARIEELQQANLVLFESNGKLTERIKEREAEIDRLTGFDGGHAEFETLMKEAPDVALSIFSAALRTLGDRNKQLAAVQERLSWAIMDEGEGGD